MQDGVLLTREQKRNLINHAIKQTPNEACALLFGTITDKKSIVKEVFLAKNQQESPVNFTISNEDLIQSYKRADEKGLDVVGIFHSHPTSEAYPSSTDKKFMLANPVVWLIYSVVSRNFKAYVLESQIKEIPVIII